MNDRDIQAHAGRVSILLDQLITILRAENEKNWIRSFVHARSKFAQAESDSDVQTALDGLSSDLRTMMRGNSSFSDYYVWRDDFEQRKRLNDDLRSIISELWTLTE